MGNIDYITLLLVNSIVGLLAGAAFLWKGLDGPNHRPWAAVFAMSGLVLLVMGVHMAATAPMRDVHLGDKVINLHFANLAFGETSVLFGALLLGVALCLAKGWDLLPMSIYAFFVGVTSIVLGAGIWNHWLTKVPPLAAVGFISAGAGAILTPLALWRPKIKALRRAAAALLALAALAWIATAYPGYWAHLGG